MEQQHKWHKEIKAWADGATIEYRVRQSSNCSFEAWEESENPRFNIDPDYEYRIKPQLKPDLVRYGAFNFKVSELGNVLGYPYVNSLWIETNSETNFQVTFADDGNGEYKLKSMEVL